jgi:hypothetical protein
VVAVEVVQPLMLFLVDLEEVLKEEDLFLEEQVIHLQ